MVPDIPREVVEAAVLQRSTQARNIMIADQTVHDSAERAVNLRVSWESDGVIHLDQFVVKRSASSERAVSERRVLEALAATGLPVPEPLLDYGSADGHFLVVEPLPGRNLADVIVTASMRWELSALAFTYARMLARLHALDWRALTPWLGDPEALPEDLLDTQLDDLWAGWEQRIGRFSGWNDDLRALFDRALAWLDLRRPVETSLCLCHGEFTPANVLVESDEVSGILGWDAARVTDAAFDLALLPYQIARLGRAPEDSELFVQAALGAYLQSSPRSLGNLPFFTVARLLTRLLDVVQAIERLSQETPLGLALEAERDDLVVSLERAMLSAGRIPWRS